MGVRHSKKSMDITAEGKGPDAASDLPKEKLEKIDDDGEKVLNGSAHKGESVVENGGDGEKAEDKKSDAASGGTAAVTAEETGKPDATSTPSPAEKSSENKDDSTIKDGESTPKTGTPDGKKDSSKKKGKKWSFRSISFSKKDKNKPQMSKESSKQEDLAKDQLPETVGENGEQSPDSEKKEVETVEKTSEKKEVEPVPAAVSVPVPVKEEIIEKCKVEKVKEEMTTVTSNMSNTVEEKTSEMESKIGGMSSELIEEVTSIIKEATQTVTETVTTVSDKKFTTITTVTEMQVDEIVPPLPISPPPTEAPPPTPITTSVPAASEPVVVTTAMPAAVESEIPQFIEVAPPAPPPNEEEVMNGGGGEGMAEVLPEENGFVSYDDDDEPKVNGHPQSPVEEIVESIIEKVEVMKITDSDKTEVEHLVVETKNEIVAQE